MRKFVICIFVLLWAGLAFASIRDMEYRYSLRYTSWAGIYPDQPDKEFNYNDILDFKTGISGSFSGVDTLWTVIGFYNDEYEKKLMLDSTGFRFYLDKYRLGYSYYQRHGIGNYSKIYDNLIFRQNISKPFLYDYCFSGVSLEKTTSRHNFFGNLGGNDYNNLVIETGWTTKNRNNFQYYGFLFTGRDNYYQENMFSFNYEAYWKKKLWWFYTALSEQILTSDSFDTIKTHTLLFAELEVYLDDFISAGGNYKARFLENKERESRLFVYSSIIYAKHELDLLYEIYKWQNNVSTETYYAIYWNNIRDNFRLGAFLSNTIQELGEMFYEAGIQVELSR